MVELHPDPLNRSQQVEAVSSDHQSPLDPIHLPVKLRLVKEAGRLFGKDAARATWLALGLPPPPEANGGDERRRVSRTINSACTAISRRLLVNAALSNIARACALGNCTSTIIYGQSGGRRPTPA